MKSKLSKPTALQSGETNLESVSKSYFNSCLDVNKLGSFMFSEDFDYKVTELAEAITHLGVYFYPTFGRTVLNEFGKLRQPDVNPPIKVFSPSEFNTLITNIETNFSNVKNGPSEGDVESEWKKIGSIIQDLKDLAITKKMDWNFIFNELGITGKWINIDDFEEKVDWDNLSSLEQSNVHLLLLSHEGISTGFFRDNKWFINTVGYNQDEHFIEANGVKKVMVLGKDFFN